MEIQKNIGSNTQVKLLAIDTSTANCSVALAIDGRIVAEYNNFNGNLHDLLLGEYVKNILSDCVIRPDEVNALAIASGPGSFTGLRIGAAFAKGFCFNGSTKLIPVNTLHSLVFAIQKFANQIAFERIFCIVHSHKKLHYTQIFDQNFHPSSEIEILELERLNDIISPKDIICGYSPFEFESGIDIKSLLFPSARFIAIAGYEKLLRREEVDSKDFVPEYFQEFTPKVKSK